MISTPEDVGRIISSWEGGDSILARRKGKTLADIWSNNEGIRSSVGNYNALAELANLIPINSMLETDEVVKNIEALGNDESIDGYLLGTNDLSRYVMQRALGRKEPLDRDNPQDAKYLTTLQPEVLKAIVTILETINRINKRRIAEGKKPKTLCMCGEIVSDYDFIIFLAMKLKKLRISTATLPITLSMAARRIRGVNEFLMNIRNEDFRDISTLLSDDKDGIGKISVDYVANQAVRKVFDRIYKSDAFKTSFDKLSGLLSRTSMERLGLPSPLTRAIATLEYIIRTKGLMDTLPVQKSKPIAPPQAKAPKAGAEQLNISQAGQQKYEKVEAVFIVTGKYGIHARPAMGIVDLISQAKAAEGALNIELRVVTPGREKVLDQGIMGLLAEAESLMRGARIMVTAEGYSARAFVNAFANLTDQIEAGGAMQPLFEEVRPAGSATKMTLANLFKSEKANWIVRGMLAPFFANIGHEFVHLAYVLFGIVSGRVNPAVLKNLRWDSIFKGIPIEIRGPPALLGMVANLTLGIVGVVTLAAFGDMHIGFKVYFLLLSIINFIAFLTEIFLPISKTYRYESDIYKALKGLKNIEFVWRKAATIFFAAITVLSTLMLALNMINPALIASVPYFKALSPIAAT